MSRKWMTIEVVMSAELGPYVSFLRASLADVNGHNNIRLFDNLSERSIARLQGILFDYVLKGATCVPWCIGIYGYTVRVDR